MAVPALAPTEHSEQQWTRLDAEAKRSRLLSAAAALFARDGIEAPMPAVAAEAGVGVGTLYRHFGSREDLIAALVVARMTVFIADARAALELDDGWEGIEQLVRTYVARQTGDTLLAEAIAATSDHADVVAVKEQGIAELDKLFARAKQQGGVHAAARREDLHLIFAATRAAEAAEPGGAQRMVELLLRALRA